MDTFGVALSKHSFLNRSSWVGFLLLNVVACVPVKQARSVSSVAADLGFGKFSGSIGGPFSGVGAGSHGGSSAAKDETISAMIANTLRMGPSNNGFQQSFMTSAFNIPVSVISPRPVYPYSYIIQTSNGYKRARNNQVNTKYVQDTFDTVQPGTPQNPGAKGDQKF
uniref:Uncharacterized protein n=1 Tax=Cyprinodon variegatus TaxID=28743 RepID=A0A3Q2E2I9_CYPVA